MLVLKNGKTYPFNKEKIRNAMIQANNQVDMPDFDTINCIVDEMEEELVNQNEEIIPVEQIEDLVMSYLFRYLSETARKYTSYKLKQEERVKNPSEIDKVLMDNKEVSQENANKNTILAHIKNAYLAEIPSKEAMRAALPKDCLEAHDKGVVYFHDMAYSIRPVHNCELLNLDELLQNGCEINSVWIEKPKSFRTACTVTTQILTHVAGNTYGGCTINLLHLAKFVDVSRQKIRKQIREELSSLNGVLMDSAFNSLINEIAEKRLLTEIKDGMQTFQYQTNTLCSSVGQAVFLTVSVWLSEDERYKDDLILVYKEMLKQRIQGVKNKNGVYENPNFPKILYFLDENTMRGGKDYDITILSAECSAKRLVPDYMSVKKHMELKGIPTPSMGCRALLSPYRDENGELVVWGRFNCGVATLNLPYIAMENNPERSREVFWSNLKHYLNIANRDMIWRVNHVAKIKSDVCPILWQQGGLAKLKPGESLESLVYGGYATVTLGYSGLYEAVKYITDEGHWEENGQKFAHEILDELNRNNKELSSNINVSVALYGTPQETLVDKFARACIREFGHVGDFSSRHYDTNSYHIPVFEKVDAFTKLKLEEQFSDKTLGGSISYVEVPNLSNNIDAMLELINFIGENCLYSEINSEVSHCENPDCMFEGYDFKKIITDDGIRWQCPVCGEKERVRTSYRVCGYLSTLTSVTRGRAEDIFDRVKHLSIEEPLV